MKRCEGVTRHGGPCGVRPLTGGSWCFNHAPDPAVREKRARARRAGGKARGIQLARPNAALAASDERPTWWSLSSASDVLGAHAWLVRQLACAQIDARTANAITAALHGVSESLAACTVERRLDALEGAVLRRLK